jgi:hypothetical protein
MIVNDNNQSVPTVVMVMILVERDCVQCEELRLKKDLSIFMQRKKEKPDGRPQIDVTVAWF